MPIIIPANSAVAGGFDVANSCRFNSASSDNLVKTPSSTGNRDKWTWSAWVKLGKLAVDQNLFTAYDASTFYTEIQIGDTGRLNFINKISGSEQGKIETERVFRDLSAWYHFVIVWDSGNATAGNRMRVYVNGVEETSFATDTNPSQDQDSVVNFASRPIYVGSWGQSQKHFNGYMSEVVLLDGTAASPSSFGEFDEDSGIWVPIDVSGLTPGTNGAYLDFEDASNLGNDVFGGTDFTENNLTAIDQATDTCTNNFATLNPLIKPAAAVTLSEGNLKGVFPGSWTALPATFGLTKGKWYFEAKNITSGQNAFIGVVSENQKWDDGTPYNETTGVVLFGPGGRKTVDNTSNDGFFATLSSGQIVGVALNLDSSTKTIQFSVNGTDTPNSTPVDLPSTFNDVFIFPYFIGNSSSATSNWELNFGSPFFAISSGNADGNGYGNFEYAVPSGFFALNTKNLAEYG